jgi:hypothetical protein
MTRNYEKLDIKEFGEHLLRSRDLDPIYCALVDSKMSRTQLHRWLLAYWVFYHAGVAPATYWGRMKMAALNLEPTPFGARWPRGHERRHMRGRNAVEAFDGLVQRYMDAPERFVEAVTDSTCGGVMRKVQFHRGFGPWIGFKVADMLERVCGEVVSFEHAEVFVFKDPKQAALLLWRKRNGLPENAKPRDEQFVLESVVRHLINEFANENRWTAPPSGDRPVGLQEVETILCKWKSHLNGHYPLNNDINEIRAGLQPWLQHSETARVFLEAMPLETLGEGQ